MSYRFFTPEEDQYLRAAHEDRLSIAEMAAVLNRPLGSIATRRRLLGLKYMDKPSGYKCKPRATLNETYEMFPEQIEEKEVDDFDANGIIVLGLLILGAVAYGAWMTAGSVI